MSTIVKTAAAAACKTSNAEELNSFSVRSRVISRKGDALLGASAHVI